MTIKATLSRSPMSVITRPRLASTRLDRETGTTDALGDQATYVYDADGDLTEDEEPTPSGQTARTTIFTFNSMNQVTVITDPLGNATTLGYDANGNLTSSQDPMGRITTTVFDALNRPTVVIDPMGNSTTTTYDGDDEAIQAVDPMGRITTSTFSNRGWVPTVTDPLNNTATYSYTATGATASSTQKGSSGGTGTLRVRVQLGRRANLSRGSALKYHVVWL